MSSYLSVLSNDTLSHLALPGAPETLCSKAIADEVQPRDQSVDQQKKPNTNWEDRPLVCDICQTLSGGDSFLKENTAKAVEAGQWCPHCDDGFDSTGDPCWNCGGTGWLEDEEDSSYTTNLGLPEDLDVENLRGTKVADVRDALQESREIADWFTASERFKVAAVTCRACGFLNQGNAACPSCGFEDDGDSSALRGMPDSEGPQERLRVEQTEEGPKDTSRVASPRISRDDWDEDEWDERAERFADPGGDSALYPATRGNPRNLPCPTCGRENVLTRADRAKGYQCDYCADQAEGKYGTKVATNWTRDGDPIEGGFNVIISTEDAARVPFLDFSRVSVSDKRECPDCHEAKWLQSIASCDGCGEMKCQSCMEVVGLDSFFGTCKKCASADSDLAYEVQYEDASSDQDRYLNYLLREDEDVEFDSLFLPGSDEV